MPGFKKFAVHRYDERFRKPSLFINAWTANLLAGEAPTGASSSGVLSKVIVHRLDGARIVIKHSTTKTDLIDTESDYLKQLALSALEDAKTEDIQVFDLREHSTISDYMIVASGNSTRQVRAAAERVAARAKESGYPPLGSEGERDGEWALVDLNDVVVHIMLPRVRAFYNLEKLWDAPVPAGQSSQAGG